MSDDAPEQTTPADDWQPPREVVLILSGLVALACAGAIFQGGFRNWTGPTLGVLLALGCAEAALGLGLVARIALAGKRRGGLFVAGIIVTVVATFALGGIVLLSGVI